jgi:hypothetical protein
VRAAHNDEEIRRGDLIGREQRASLDQGGHLRLGLRQGSLKFGILSGERCYALAQRCYFGEQVCVRLT